MGKHIEIKWHGRAGQGVVTAASLTAEVLAMAGKYVQAFPEFIPKKTRTSLKVFNRISNSPIRIQSKIQHVDAVVLMDVRMLLDKYLKEKTTENTIYVVNLNASYTPEFVKAKLNLDEDKEEEEEVNDSKKIHILDADKIAHEELGLSIPNVPLMAILLDALQIIPREKLEDHLKTILTSRMSSETAAANISSIQRAFNEVTVV